MAQTKEFGYYEEDGYYGWYDCDEDDICYYCEHNGDYDYECGMYYVDEDGQAYQGEFTDIWMWVTDHSEYGEVDTWVHIDVVADAVESDSDDDGEEEGEEGDLKECKYVKEWCYN